MGNTRSVEKNTILYSDLAYKWNILEPTIEYPRKYDIIFHLGLPQEYAYSYSPCRTLTPNPRRLGLKLPCSYYWTAISEIALRASFDEEFCRFDYWKLEGRISSAHRAPLISLCSQYIRPLCSPTGIYTAGGVCRVGATHRDTLLAVYAACGPFGAQQPLGFSNSESHTVIFMWLSIHRRFIIQSLFTETHEITLLFVCLYV